MRKTAVEPKMYGEQMEAQDEALMLMSLALDGLLEADEKERLQRLVAADPALNDAWRRWQQMDAFLATTPRIEPAPGFMSRFATRLEHHERRARIRQGIIFTATAVVVWAALLAMVAGLGWLLLVNQTQWMNAFVRDLAVYPSAALTWLRALWTSLSAMVGEPQTLVLLVGFACFSLALLGVWFRFLQRSTQEEVIS